MPPRASPDSSRPDWRRHLTGPWAAVFLLVGFWLLLVASVRTKSLTYDEGVHALAGYSFWKFGDYRINPENGNLPQRLFGIPLAFRGDTPPPTDGVEWHESDKWALAYTWLFGGSNDADAMVFAGRTAAALLTVALAALVWLWARHLFGPTGGIISLLLCVLSPTVLANGALMTSDIACAFFFLAATGAGWALLHRITAGRLLLSVAATSGLFLSKMSAVLIGPIALILLAARLIDGRPLPVQLVTVKELRTRCAQAVAFAAIALVHVLVVAASIWLSHGGRFTAFAPDHSADGDDWAADIWEFVLDQPSPRALLDELALVQAQRERVDAIADNVGANLLRWTPASRDALSAIDTSLLTPEQQRQLAQRRAAAPPSFAPRVVAWLRDHHLLPEAYLYGFAHAWRYSRSRSAFLNGDFSATGWRMFFPYTFLVKTPLPVFALIGLALAAGIRLVRPAATFFYATLPLWTLFAAYWAAAISSHLNIGHRHILATHPPLFILCGVAATWWNAAPSLRSARAARVALVVFMILLGLDVAWRFPHYLAYFNGIVRPAHAYRHLVESSLDWGQDLAGLARRLEKHPPTGPVYLSYFGTASPASYRIPATLLPARSGREHAPPVRFLSVPAATSSAALQEFIGQHPEYDENVAASAREGDMIHLMLVKKPDALRLTGGTYCISATMLQPLKDVAGPWGPWNSRFEGAYQALRPLVAPLCGNDPAARRALLRQLQPDQWERVLNDFEEYRFARLTAWLRQREPDDNIGYSILIYHLSDADIAQALEGPPAELGPDLPTLLNEDTP